MDQHSPIQGNRGGRHRVERYSDAYTYQEQYLRRYPEHYTEQYPDQRSGQYVDQRPMPYSERCAAARYADPYQDQQHQDPYRPFADKYPERYVRQYPERSIDYAESRGERCNAYQSSSLFADPRTVRQDMPPLPQQMPPPPPSVQSAPPPVPPPPPAPKKSRAREAPAIQLGSVPENMLGSPELPSVGSRDHRLGQCKPCAFLVKGCQNGIMCKFCHLCDAGEKMLWRK
ncbi:hpaIIM [Symbiodinium natans]|uniref:HpaIIM protein n=1 Tax=Symbiodinium natans TaxID=878477 RepID=A0A812LEB1_9DINO|nr:hpaIIM [Symbiodinium natans]